MALKVISRTADLVPYMLSFLLLKILSALNLNSTYLASLALAMAGVSLLLLLFATRINIFLWRNSDRYRNRSTVCTFIGDVRYNSVLNENWLNFARLVFSYEGEGGKSKILQCFCYKRILWFMDDENHSAYSCSGSFSASENSML